jgi:acyl dehydratase
MIIDDQVARSVSHATGRAVNFRETAPPSRPHGRIAAMTAKHYRLDELRSLVGKEVALSDWLTITQERIHAFAEVGEDRQWIHVDPERAQRESLYGGAIAHGFLTVALLSHLRESAFHIDGQTMGVNYGFNRLRFTAPVLAGSRIRGRFVLHEVEDLPGGVQTTWRCTVEREHADKPALVCDWITRHYG